MHPSRSSARHDDTTATPMRMPSTVSAARALPRNDGGHASTRAFRCASCGIGEISVSRARGAFRRRRAPCLHVGRMRPSRIVMTRELISAMSARASRGRCDAGWPGSIFGAARALVALWRIEVARGSSARARGQVTSARAMATLCCCPRRAGSAVWCMRSSRPTSRKRVGARCLRLALSDTGGRRAGSSTSRARCCGEQVIALEHEADHAVSDDGPRVARSVATSTRSSRYLPRVGRSRQPRCSSSCSLPSRSCRRMPRIRRARRAS